jgi:aminocarboxymuconate-semialdehyde decarboxylase
MRSSAQPHPPGSLRRHSGASRRNVIIDIHAHYVPQSLLDDLKAQKRLFPSLRTTAEKGGLRLAFGSGKLTRPVSGRLADLVGRHKWLTEQHIDRQVVGGWLDMFAYGPPSEEGADWSRYLNDHMRAGVKQLTAFAPLATVPLQSVQLAARVLEEALDAGFHGAMVGTQPSGVGGALDDPDLDPLWEVASARKATLFLHPMFACGDDWLDAYDLVNAIGRITDTTHAVARLLYSGHLARYGGVNVVIAHGGAALPYVLGRLSRNRVLHPEYADPSSGFRRLYFDSVLFEARALRFLCDVAGADKVMLGSDHPFPIGDPEPMKVIEEASLTAQEKRCICCETAARLFRVPLKPAS